MLSVIISSIYNMLKGRFYFQKTQNWPYLSSHFSGMIVVAKISFTFITWKNIKNAKET